MTLRMSSGPRVVIGNAEEVEGGAEEEVGTKLSFSFPRPPVDFFVFSAGGGGGMEWTMSPPRPPLS
jgi:hypothetical protein